MRKFVEKSHNKSFRDIFIDTPLVGTKKNLVRKLHIDNVSTAVLVSDFNLIGAFAHYFAPELVHEINTLTDARQETCVSQCNTRIFTTECCKAWFKSLEDFQHAPGAPAKGV